MIEAATGTPAAAAGLIIEEGGKRLGRGRVWKEATNDEGMLRIDSIPIGTVSITAHHRRSRQAQVEAGRTTEVEIVIPDGIDVRGIVVDAGGIPVAGAKVWLTHLGISRSGMLVTGTHEDGTFFLRSLEGMEAIGARAPGHSPSLLYTVSDLEAVEGEDRFARGGARPGVRIRVSRRERPYEFGLGLTALSAGGGSVRCKAGPDSAIRRAASRSA